MLRFPLLRFLVALFIGCFALPALAAKTILVFGDSLSAGYGIRQEAAWPALLAKRLKEKKFDYNVVNASISGETTSGGRTRIDTALARNSPEILILALGANDGLRGLPLATLRDNLAAIASSAQARKAQVLIIGQRLPPNYGKYAEDFHKVFGDVAKSRKAAFVDFLLDGIADNRQFFQADNLHPTAEAQPQILDTVWRGLAPLLK